MKIEIDVEIPEGYEATGEYRRPEEGKDEFLDTDGEGFMIVTSRSTFTAKLILRKKKLSFQDFDPRVVAGYYVSVSELGYVEFMGEPFSAAEALLLHSAFLAAADHVNKVRNQEDEA